MLAFAKNATNIGFCFNKFLPTNSLVSDLDTFALLSVVDGSLPLGTGDGMFNVVARRENGCLFPIAVGALIPDDAEDVPGAITLPPIGTNTVECPLG